MSVCLFVRSVGLVDCFVLFCFWFVVWFDVCVCVCLSVTRVILQIGARAVVPNLACRFAQAGMSCASMTRLAHARGQDMAEA